jgi:hypothetical protein
MYSSKGDSSAMASILNPTNGYRGSLQSKGIKPKNHMAEHRAALRKKEQDNKTKQDQMNATTSKLTMLLDSR